MEREDKIDGIKDEMEKVIKKYGLPAPTRLLSRKQYSRQVKRRVNEESRKEIREGLIQSRKLQYLIGEDQKKGPQIDMTDLQRIQFLTRCRLSCHFEFEGDFGSRTPCPCGEADTLSHVRRGCPEYRDLLPPDPKSYFGVENTEKIYRKIFERKRSLRTRPPPTNQATCPGSIPTPRPPLLPAPPSTPPAARPALTLRTQASTGPRRPRSGT